MSKTIIVVGLSASSMAFITKLRSFDKDSKVIAFSAENDFPYNRCFLADYLVGDSSLQEIELKPKDFFEQNNIQVFLNTRVEKIDTQKNLIFVQEQSYSYDYLFLGIGTRPYIPKSFEGINCEGVFTFHTLEDMQKIESFIEHHNPKSAVVIGAGLNGIEAVSSLAQKGISVAVIEAQQSILPGQVDLQTAAWLTAQARHKGITVLEGRKAVGVCKNGQTLSAVQLETGTNIAANMLIIAAGSALNYELLEGTGIKLEKGSIVVDQNMRSSVSHVLAGGDICAVPDMVTQKLTRSTTWSDAMLQGLCAATTLSATPRAYPGMVGLRDSYFFGKDFYACGQTHEVTSFVKTVCKQTSEELEVLFTDDGVLKGFVLIGDVSRVAELKKFYLSQHKIC